MATQRWHILTSGDTLTLARHLPPRFDVVAETRLPAMGRRRLAHQVRQDVWRALRRVRGFSPVVEVTRDGAGLTLRAGGRVAGACPPALTDRIAGVLSDPANRARWARFSGEEKT